MFSGRGSGVGDVLGAGISFLQPGYAHTLAEKRRQALRREQTGEGAPPEVDLDAGVIRLTPPPEAGPAAARRADQDDSPTVRE